MTESTFTTLVSGPPMNFFQESHAEVYGLMNADAVFPSATGVPSQSSVIWKIASQSYWEGNEGEAYIEIIHELQMNILSTDIIEFKTQFTSDETLTGTLTKDEFVCTL